MTRTFKVTALTGLLVLLAAPAAHAAEDTGPVDTAINNALAPVADRLSAIVFWTIPGLPVDLPLILLWLIAGATFFTVSNKFINIRGFGHSVAVLRGKYDDPDDPGETTHFQALMTALSATVGLGNIAGVAVAITIGGPGATFWMVVAAFLGMSTKFVECSLAVKYRHEYEDGHVTGGPMFYIERLRENHGWPAWLAKGAAAFFALATIGGAIGAANLFQVGQAYQQYVTQVGRDSALAVPGWIFGLVMAIAVGIVIIGGIRSIARVTEKLVPVMAGIYILAALVILAVNLPQVPAALGSIIGGAFTGQGVTGGLFGALVAGVQRSAFSNEAGLGSAAIAHSSARTDLWIREGFVAQLGPFIDTVIICTATALVIVVTGVYEGAGADVQGVTLTSEAFAQRIPWFPWVLMVAVIMFAFSTIISWSYYGTKASNYLFGESILVVRSFQVVFCICIVIGGALTLDKVVPLMDSLLFLMPITNILALFAYSKEIRGDLREYWSALQSGEMLTYEEEKVAAG